MKNRHPRVLCVVALLLMCAGSAAAQRTPAASPTSAQPPQKTSVEVTGRVLNEKGNPVEGKKVDILITNADCSCLFDPSCKNKTCIECCTRAMPISRVKIAGGSYNKNFEVIPGLYKVIILEKNGSVIFESTAIEVAGGKQDIKVPVLQPLVSTTSQQ
jgi:hypothetical protein